MIRYGSEELDHTADTGIRVRAAEVAELFEYAAQGMFRLILDHAAGDQHCRTDKIRLDAESADSLLHAWLSELLFLHSVHHIIPVHVRIEICSAEHVAATVQWTKLDTRLAELATEIKAVTWHGLFVRCEKGSWIAEVIFDT